MITIFLLGIVLAFPNVEGRSRFVETLELVQLFGTSRASDPSHDEELKIAISKAIKDGFVTSDELGDFITRPNFAKISGTDLQLDAHETKAALETMERTRLPITPELKMHAEYLTTTFDMIDDSHRTSGAQLSGWIAQNYRSDEPLGVICVCTGNSRRSILACTMGNLAASYYGFEKLRFYSGGTTPSAFNPRTIKTLSAIGFKISETGEEALRGDAKTINRKYRVQWGDGLEAIEFSKHYSDPTNPSSGFAALMVCTEADGECPLVKGAALRISMPYLDPKIYDDDSLEPIKYAERRDDVGRLMLSVMAQARAEMATQTSTSR